MRAEAAPPKFNYNLTQDSWRIAFKTLRRQDDSGVRASHIDDVGLGALLHCCLKPYFMKAHRICMREECLALTKEDLVIRLGEEMGSGEGAYFSHTP